MMGACILLNANHRRERRAQTAAHELGHFVSARDKPDVRRTEASGNSRGERYASSFARGFVMPQRAVAQMFQEITFGSSKLTRRHVITLAHAFGVSRDALVLRLEELELVPNGMWAWFLNHGGITDEQAREFLGNRMPPDERGTDAELSSSLRRDLMASEAWRRGLLSEGQLARLLRVDRIGLRQLLDTFDAEQAEAEEAPALDD
jgi:Zn-dependent peptidase ImmA (M78 family)